MRRLQMGPYLTLSLAVIVLLTMLGSMICLWQFRQMREQTQRLAQLSPESISAGWELALQHLEQAQQQTFTALLITGLLASVTLGAMLYVIARTVAQPVARLDAEARGLFQIGLEKMVEKRTQELLQSSEELERRYLQLETGIAVGHRLTSILDLDTLLNEVVELIRGRYGFYYVGVFLGAEQGDDLIARAGTGETGRALCRQGFRLKVGDQSIIGWVARYRRPARIDDVTENGYYKHLDIGPGTRSELALPLIMGGTVLGILDLHSDNVMAFRLDDLPVLQSLANQVAVAIQNASAYYTEQTRRRQAETLYHAGRAISSTLDLTEVLDLILEHLAQIVSYDRAAVILQDHDELEIVAARGFPAEVQPLQLRISIQENDVFQQIYHSQQPLNISDVLQRPDWQHVTGLPLARAWLGVPLTRFDKVIGMLSLAREALDTFNDDEVTLAATFAGQAAIALENARLYDKISRFTQQLEDMVRERTEAVQEAYSRLEHLDRTKTDFINIAAHELRTPLTVLRGYSKMLLADPKMKESAYLMQLVSGINSGTMRLHEIVNSMLEITKIDNRALQLYPEPLDIPTLLQLVCQEYREALAERKQTLIITDMSCLPAVEADPDALPKVFSHLISNAIKYTPDGGTITISGQALANGREDLSAKGVEIIISDTGIGIDHQFHELIFTKFYQTGELALHSTSKTKFKGAGPGLGLTIARGIIEAHRGRLWVESPGYDPETYPGSQFHLFLPLRQNKPKAQQNAGPANKVVPEFK